MEQWKLALADAEEAFSELSAQASSISIRTPELEETELLRDSIRKRVNPEEGK